MRSIVLTLVALALVGLTIGCSGNNSNSQPKPDNLSCKVWNEKLPTDSTIEVVAVNQDILTIRNDEGDKFNVVDAAFILSLGKYEGALVIALVDNVSLLDDTGASIGLSDAQEGLKGQVITLACDQSSPGKVMVIYTGNDPLPDDPEPTKDSSHRA